MYRYHLIESDTHKYCLIRTPDYTCTNWVDKLTPEFFNTKFETSRYTLGQDTSLFKNTTVQQALINSRMTDCKVIMVFHSIAFIEDTHPELFI